MILTTLHPITSSFFRLEPSSLSNGHSLWHDNIHVIESEKEWSVSVDVPGVKADNIDIKVEGGILHITGIRKFETLDGHVAKKLKFSNSFELPTQKYGDIAIDPQQLDASLLDGVLVLKAPKKPEAQPITISISTKAAKAGGDGAGSEKEKLESSPESSTKNNQ